MSQDEQLRFKQGERRKRFVTRRNRKTLVLPKRRNNGKDKSKQASNSTQA